MGSFIVSLTRSLILFYQMWTLKDNQHVRSEIDQFPEQLGVIARQLKPHIASEGKERLKRAAEEMAVRLWPNRADRPGYDDLETALNRASEYFSAEALAAQLKQWGFRNVEMAESTSDNRIADREGVPTLKAFRDTLDLSDPTLMRAYHLFLSRYPTKHWIWTRFQSPRGSILLFFEDGPRKLTLVADLQDNFGKPVKLDRELVGIDRQKLLGVPSLAQLARSCDTE